MADNAKNPRTHTARSRGALLAWVLLSSPLQAVVISEIHYHPPEGQEALEFIEITNDAYSPEDISGWAFVEGIAFEFPPGTIVRGREALVVCTDVDALRTQYGIDNAIGNYDGKLDGSGERVTLVNYVGVVMQSLRYRDGGKWPVGPDGTGHSLILTSVNLDTSEPESWAQSPQLGGSPGLPNQPALEPAIFFNELFRSATDVQGDGWVEIYNSSSNARDVSGWSLTDDPDRTDPHMFAAGTTIPPGGFLVVQEQQKTLMLSAAKVQLFLRNPQGVTEAAATFERAPVDGLALGDYSEALFPDGNFPGGHFPRSGSIGSAEVWVTPTPTQGSANEVPRVTDLVINEIFYHAPEERDDEFLELFNRGTEVLDISGFRFTKGIGYTFPAGTSLGPGAYLVLAAEPEILEEHYGYAGALRWSLGSLSNGGENLQIVDRRGNLVDEVRYFEGGNWSRWADGRGASLELIDPRQDNDFAAAWGASVQPEKSVWEEHSFTVPEYAGLDSKLTLLLVERGICRIDDVSIQDSPPGTDNFIPNPGFEDDTLPWLLQGTHIESERITRDAHSGQACLELVASSKGDTRCNRVETDTEPALADGNAYEVSLWTRWLRGSSLLVVRGDFSAGATLLSGNAISATLRMTVPRDLGTPGAENSVRVALREETGSDNLGPVIADVVHSPVSPPPCTPVTVRAPVADSDGVASARVFFREDVRNPDPFQSAELFEVSAIGDTYSGTIPALASNQVAFYVEATDALGAVNRYPAEAPKRTLFYRTEGPVAEPLHVFISHKSFRTLATRSVQSNNLVEGTVVLDDEQVHYGVGVRYRGSALAGRVQQPGVRVRFPDDSRFKERVRDINLSSRDRSDGATYVLIGRNGTAEKPTAVTDYKFIQTRFTGNPFGIAPLGNVGMFEPIDRDLIEKWYGADAAQGGVVLKGVSRSSFDADCKITAFDASNWRHRGENPENYRFYWFHSINQTRDHWQPLVDVTRILDASVTPDAEFVQLFESVVDVEAFLRGFMPRVLMNDRDALFLTSVHNGYVFWDPSDTEARWSYLAFDMGAAWRSQVEDLLAIRDDGVRRFLTQPGPQRMYYGMIHQYMQGYWSVEVAGPFLDALGEDVGLGSVQKSFLAESTPRLEAMLEPFLTVELRILTNNGEDFDTETRTVELEGEAAVQLASFQLRNNDGAPQLFEPTWSTPTQWRAAVSLGGGVNRLEIFAFDAGDAPAGTVAITISRPEERAFIRGDANGDQSVNIIDAIATIGFLFQGLSLSCPDAADVDDSGTVNLTDAVGALEYLVTQGPAPLAPFPSAGVDPTQDLMECFENE